MKLIVIALLVVAAVAKPQVNFRYGSSYDVPQGSVTGAAKLFQITPTSPSPLLRIPIHEAQDFNAQISNFGNSGFSTPAPILDSGYTYTTPAPIVNARQSFFSTTPAPSVEVNSFSTPAPIISGGFVQTTAAPSIGLNSRFQFPSNLNFGFSGYSTPSPIVNFGTGQLTSIDPVLFNQDAGLNGLRVTTSGILGDTFGISTPSSLSAEVYENVPQVPQVHRHIYFFAAPEEPEPIRPRIRIASQPQKNVRVIFVKAPSPPAIAPVQITAPQQNEEKTVVYVLVKKPEENQEIRVEPAPTPAPPKPEVFFIKYSNQQEAEQAIESIQAGQPHGQPQLSVGDINGGSAFLNSLNRQVYVKPEPIVNYVKTSSQLPYFGFTSTTPSVGLGLQQASFNSFPILNSKIAVTTPAPIQFTTSAPIELNSGLSFTTAAPTVNIGGAELASRSQLVDTPVVVDNPVVNQNLLENSIETSSETVPLDNIIDDSVSSTLAPEGFISSTTAAPETILNNNYNNYDFSNFGLPGNKFGVYAQSTNVPFRTYGAPDVKK